MSVLPISATRLTELQNATAQDQLLQCVSRYIQNGWPERSSSVPQQARKYFLFRDELTLSDNIVMKGLKAVIPKSLQATYAKILHDGHIGCEATKRRARDIVFWTSMTQDIENLVSNCSVCNSIKAHQQKEPCWVIQPNCTMGNCWSGFGDSYSTWFDFVQLTDFSSHSVIQILKRQFSTWHTADSHKW